MERNIKDYLHLYLGCDMWLCKNIEGNEVIEPLTAKMLHEDIYECEMDYKPLLRPLSDMTEKEEEEISVIANSIDEVETTEGAGRAAGIMTYFLLSKHFDLFGLIESGLALDKTKIK